MLASVPSSLIDYSGSKDPQTLRQTQNMISQIQMEAMSWSHTVMPKYLLPTNKAFTFYIRKLLFLETIHTYYGPEVLF